MFKIMSLARIFKLNPVKTSLLHVRSLSCWSCGQEVNNLVVNLFCSKCNVLQKPEPGWNYFRVLGVKETFDLDAGELAKKYKDLQKYLHPDKFASRKKEEQEVSEKYSSLVNEAYKTLLEPLARGIYMLKLRGKEIPEKTEVIDQKFLMEIMEKNEEVENAETEAELLRIDAENKTQMLKLQKQVSMAFFDGDVKTVIKLLGIMKYYTSIDTQIQSLIRSRGIVR